MTYELRRAGVPTEMYLGAEKGLGKQIKYADRCGIPLVVIYGSDEKAKGMVTLKDLEAGAAGAAGGVAGLAGATAGAGGVTGFAGAAAGLAAGVAGLAGAGATAAGLTGSGFAAAGLASWAERFNAVRKRVSAEVSFMREGLGRIDWRIYGSTRLHVIVKSALSQAP